MKTLKQALSAIIFLIVLNHFSVLAQTGTLPDHMIVVGAGMGYDSEENEFGVCFGTTYLFRVASSEDLTLFIGGGANLDFIQGTGGRSDYTNYLVSFSPSMEMFIPIKQGPVYIKTGLTGGYGFGELVVGDTRRNKSAGNFDAFAGVFVQLGRAGLCFESSFIRYQKEKIQNNNGDIVNNSFKFGLSKLAPLKVSVAIGFGGTTKNQKR